MVPSSLYLVLNSHRTAIERRFSTLDVVRALKTLDCFLGSMINKWPFLLITQDSSSGSSSNKSRAKLSSLSRESDQIGLSKLLPAPSTLTPTSSKLLRLFSLFLSCLLLALCSVFAESGASHLGSVQSDKAPNLLLASICKMPPQTR
jgi:hypothetical protein